MSAATLSLIPTQRRVTADLSARGSATAAPRAHAFIADLAAGIREIRRRTWLAATVGVSCITALLGAGPLVTVIPIVAHSSLGGVRAYSYIVAALAGGGVIGGIVASRFEVDRPMAVSAIALVGLAAAPLALAIPLSLPGVIVAFSAAGVCQTLGQALFGTCMIRAVPSDAIGRVSAWDSLGSLALRPLGQALGGAVAGAFGVDAVLWGCCAILMAAPVSLAAIPDVRNFRIE